MSDNQNVSPEHDGTLVGAYLKQTRLALGLTLRAVEEMTNKQVTNGYLSQIESGTAKKPSARILYHLAEAYNIDYGDLLVRAGLHAPRREPVAAAGSVAGVPLRALEELTEPERQELLDYLAFIRAKRASRAT